MGIKRQKPLKKLAASITLQLNFFEHKTCGLKGSHKAVAFSNKNRKHKQDRNFWKGKKLHKLSFD
jgi:hypothetical protein